MARDFHGADYVVYLFGEKEVVVLEDIMTMAVTVVYLTIEDVVLEITGMDQSVEEQEEIVEEVSTGIQIEEDV